MIEISWRYDPSVAFVEPVVATPADAVRVLSEGSAAFAAVTDADPGRLVIPVTREDLGLGPAAGQAPRQAPFAGILGCADARVPLELLLSQSANDLFVVRVAGNVPAAECVGSLDYAVTHIAELRLLAVVGHTGCGAVGAAVDSYLDPASYPGTARNLELRAIVDAIMASVRSADIALRSVHGDSAASRPGYRVALIDTAVVLNAALAADCVRARWASRIGPELDVAFGVYDLAHRQVGVPLRSAGSAWVPGLQATPSGAALDELVRDVAGSEHVEALLASSPSGSH